MADDEAVKIIQGVIDKCRARVGVGGVTSEDRYDKYDDWRMARAVELREAVDLLTAAPVQEVKPVAWEYEVKVLSRSEDSAWVKTVSLQKPKPDRYRRNVRPLYAHPAPSAPAQEAVTRAREALSRMPDITHAGINQTVYRHALADLARALAALEPRP